MLRPNLERISVVVPNFEYERYMPSRLVSVFDQSYPIFETIVLDDASGDNSLQVIEDVITESRRRVKVVASESNSGNVFAQWRRGVDLARGKHLWIAEADDLADPQFLAETVSACTDSTVLCFTDSVQIGTDDEVLANSYDYYYKEVDSELFQQDFQLDGESFVRRALAERNVILNVSSVLWRRASLASALDRVGGELEDYRLVGDWRLYLEVLGQQGASISYVSEALNVHRRHPTSVTHAMDPERHIREVLAMHASALKLVGAASETEQRQKDYAQTLRTQFGLADQEETPLGRAA